MGRDPYLCETSARVRSPRRLLASLRAQSGALSSTSSQKGGAANSGWPLSLALFHVCVRCTSVRYGVHCVKCHRSIGVSVWLCDRSVVSPLITVHSARCCV